MSARIPLRAPAGVAGDSEQGVVWSSGSGPPILLTGIEWLGYQIIDGIASESELAEDIADVFGLPNHVASARVGDLLNRFEASRLIGDPSDMPAGVAIFPLPGST